MAKQIKIAPGLYAESINDDPDYYRVYICDYDSSGSEYAGQLTAKALFRIAVVQQRPLPPRGPDPDWRFIGAAVAMTGAVCSLLAVLIAFVHWINH